MDRILKSLSDLVAFITTNDVNVVVLMLGLWMLPLFIYLLFKYMKTETRQPPSESYLKIADCLLLHKIIGRLPFRDQLIARGVNKEWGNETLRSLRQSKMCCVKLFNNEQICTFMSTFPSDLASSDLFSYTTFEVKPMRISIEELERFGRLHGSHVQCLKLYVTTGDNICAERTRESAEESNMKANLQMMAKVMTLLTYFPNLRKLTMEPDNFFGEPHLYVLDDRDISDPLLPCFDNLEQIEALTNTSIISLLDDIVAKATNLQTVNLDLEEYSDKMSFTGQLFEKLKTINVEKLRVFLNCAAEATSDNLLLRELNESEVQPKALQLYLTTMCGAKEDKVEERKHLIYEWIKTLTKKRLTKLSFRTWEKVTELKLPKEMPHLTYLSFGTGVLNAQRDFPQYFGPGIVEPVRPIRQRQVPALTDLVIDPEGQQMHFDEVFTSVKNLTILDGETPSHYDWTTKFPNLTKLEMVAGEDGSLTSVLTNMVSLTELKVTFRGVWLESEGNAEDKYCFTGERVSTWWDALTGAIRPILNQKSSLKSILSQKPSAIPRSWGDALTYAKLANLCNLKTLTLVDTPASIVLAIIHLTALKKIPVLYNLEIFTSKYDPYRPQKPCIDLLENVHERVKIASDGQRKKRNAQD